LFPALGFFDSQYSAFWQVSDHLQYLPMIAPLSLAVAGIAARPYKILFPALTTVGVVVFSVLTYQRALVFTSDENLMRDSIAKNPDDWYARNELGIILAKRNDPNAAFEQFETAARINPANAKARLNFGRILALTGKLGEAETNYRAALLLNPSDENAQLALADLLRQENRNGEAVVHYLAALAIKPNIQAELSLAGLYYTMDLGQRAINQYQQVLRVAPENLEALNDLAWLLATSGDVNDRNGIEAVRLAEKACSLTHYKQPRFTGTLAAAYAEAGRFSDAVYAGQSTVKLANDLGDQRMTVIAKRLLDLYRAGKPYHASMTGGPTGQ
jgi:tetratricopeptide (TPR) repeat protein